MLVALAKAHGTRGELLEREAGRMQDARAEFGTELDLWDEIERVAPGEPAHDRGRAFAHLRRGTLLLAIDTGAARTDLETALRTFEHPLDLSADDPRIRYAIADSLGALAHTYLLEHNDTRAIELVRKSLAIHEGLAHDFPDTASYLHNFCNGRLQLARLLTRDRSSVEEAWTLVEDALEDCGKLLDRSPDLYSHQWLRAILLHQRAMTFERRPGAKVVDAIAAYKDAAEQFRVVARRRPTGEREHCQLGDAVSRLAILQHYIGAVDAATQSMRKAVRAERIAKDAGKNNPNHKKSLARYERLLREWAEACEGGR